MKVRQLYDVGARVPRATPTPAPALLSASVPAPPPPLAPPSPSSGRRRSVDRLAMASQLLSLRRLLGD